MLKFAALALAAATASAPTALVSQSPWWEKITVVVNDDGDAQSCTYESSLRNAPTDACQVVADTPSVNAASAGGSPDEFTRITFERRFTPSGTQPQRQDLHPGDTLLGGQILALAIDGAGSVNSCKVVAASGEMTPDYGCNEATKERFETSHASGSDAQVSFMTIMVYGHNEHVA